MATIYLGLGSNIEPERYLCAGLDALAELLGELRCSSVYRSEAVGFAGADFLNLVVAAETELEPAALAEALRLIEYGHGREPGAPKFSSRSLDIDLLLYDQLCGNIAGLQLPRPEVLFNAFVLAPMAELAPQDLHPVSGRSYAQLWQQFGRQDDVRRVGFAWRGRAISLPDKQKRHTVR